MYSHQKKFRKRLLAHLVSLAVTGGLGMLVSLSASTAAFAQSNATGTVYGKLIPNTASSLTLKNLDTNLSRSVTIEASGQFQITALPVGRYQAELFKDQQSLGTQILEVLAGQGSEVNPALFSTAAVQSVEVTARRTRIDVSNASNGNTFTATELAKLPVAQSIDGIIQLAANTTNADVRYAGGASFGGGAPSENSYYINGYPVVNPLTQLGSSDLPFGAIQQAQIMTGGFGAEFGRSVGGVVNIISKSGSNRWEFGAMASITPNSLRATPLDIYYPRTGAVENQATDGKLYLNRHSSSRTEKKIGAYLGGPIIADKLFMFLAAENTRTDIDGMAGNTSSASLGKNGYSATSHEVQRYFAKFDWNLHDDHRLEAMLIGDTPKATDTRSGYDPASGKSNGVIDSRGYYQNVDEETLSNGADIQMLKYTGNLTPDLVLTALVGQSTIKHKNSWDGYDPKVQLLQVVTPVSAMVPGLNYINPQKVSGDILPEGAEDTVKSYRLDLEYKLGSHTLRAGLDSNRNSSQNAGVEMAGGGAWTFARVKNPFAPVTLSGQRVVVGNSGGFGKDGYYVRRQIFFDTTNAYSDQTAQYIEDRYQLNKDVLITAGLRNEGYTNKNGDNVPFLEINRQLQPRLSVSWDVNGDSTFKVFGSAGRYSVPIPTHLAVRGASRSTYTRQYFTYTGIDPVTGAPTGLNAMTEPVSSNNEYGQAKLAATVAALDMKPNMQDEMTIGFEKAYSVNLNYGAKLTYRRLVSTIDDLCDSRPIENWAARNQVDTSNWGGFNCASFNPGEANAFMVDFSGRGKNLTRVDLSAADLGMPKAERTYTAFDVFLEHPYRNGWYGKINYTWSRSKGNTEGQTLSDVGQTDVSATRTWDHWELMSYANGLLPNNRTHQIKAFGFYDLNKQWTIGANLLLASGRPKNCIGSYPDALQALDPGFPDYGSAYRFCNGQPSPRGTAGNLPWTYRLDLNAAYRPEVLPGVTFKVDVFNVLNRQSVQTIDEQYNAIDGRSVSPTYGRTISYTAPRTVRLMVEYNKKF